MSQSNLVKIVLDHPDAVLPTKGTPYSIGYDLTAVAVAKVVLTPEGMPSRTTLYDTGLIVEPPQGYYTEILPRSSISKSGYVLSNSVGQVDWDYRGHLLIALTKVDDSMPELKLPFNLCQLKLARYEDYELDQVSKEELTTTERGDGGFGSTNDKSTNKTTNDKTPVKSRVDVKSSLAKPLERFR